MSISNRLSAVVLAGAALAGWAQAQSTGVVQPGVQAATNNSLTGGTVGGKANLGNSLDLIGGIEHSKELGALIRTGVATRLGADGAVYTEIAVGEKNRELFIQAGLNVGSSSVVMFTFQNLEQYRNFVFPSGEANEWVSHQAIGLSGRTYFDNKHIKFAEVQGYHIDANSKDLSDKEFTTSGTLMSDPRMLAGSTVSGAKWVVRFWTVDNRFTLDVEWGIEKITPKTTIETPTTTRGVGGLKFGYHPTPTTEVYTRASQVTGTNTIDTEIGWKGDTMRVAYSTANGGTAMIQASIPLDSSFRVAKKPTPQSTYQRESTPNIWPKSVSYSEFIKANPNWTPETQSQINTPENITATRTTRDILSTVAERPTWVPKTVSGVTVDTTAKAKTVVVTPVDPMPTGPALANVTTSDNGWWFSISNINTGGIVDSQSRSIIYTVNGLPTGLTINASTGIINGIYDANGTEIFNITVTATPTGWSNPLVRTFVLTITDAG